jgi:hypothetical protein
MSKSRGSSVTNVFYICDMTRFCCLFLYFHQVRGQWRLVSAATHPVGGEVVLGEVFNPNQGVEQAHLEMLPTSSYQHKDVSL